MTGKNLSNIAVLSAAVACSLGLILSAFAYGLFFSVKSAQASTSVPVTGWLWSDTIGWIDTNCQNTDTCATNNFGLAIDSVSGAMSGYAWSDNIGWISANSSDLSGCPSAPCTASISGASVTGWFKAVSGGASQNGDWDGFIALDDKNTGDGLSYGVSYSGGSFSGYAWADTNVGWVDFSLAQTQYLTCSPSTVYTCNGSQIVVSTETDSSCQDTVTNTTCVAPQFCSLGSPVCLTPTPSGLTGSGDLTGNLTARPNLVPKNATTTVYWDMANVTNCSVTGNDGTSWTGATSATSSCSVKSSTGCVTSPIITQTIFTLSCLDLDSNPYTETATVNLLPDFEEK
jgi:hypothetical protein